MGRGEVDDNDRRKPRGVRGLTGDFPKLGAPTYAPCVVAAASQAPPADRVATGGGMAMPGAEEGTGIASPPAVPDADIGEARLTPASEAPLASLMMEDEGVAADTAFSAESKFAGGTSRSPCGTVPSGRASFATSVPATVVWPDDAVF